MYAGIWTRIAAKQYKLSHIHSGFVHIGDDNILYFDFLLISEYIIIDRNEHLRFNLQWNVTRTPHGPLFATFFVRKMLQQTIAAQKIYWRETVEKEKGFARSSLVHCTYCRCAWKFFRFHKFYFAIAKMWNSIKLFALNFQRTLSTSILGLTCEMWNVFFFPD